MALLDKQQAKDILKSAKEKTSEMLVFEFKVRFNTASTLINNSFGEKGFPAKIQYYKG